MIINQLRANPTPRVLDWYLSSVLVLIEQALQMDKDIDRLGWLLNNRDPECQRCNSTGELPGETFDNLCPDCTPDHCVFCGQMDGRLIDYAAYLLCPTCQREEREQS